MTLSIITDTQHKRIIHDIQDTQHTQSVIATLYHNAECRFAECCVQFVVMLSVVMLNVVMLVTRCHLYGRYLRMFVIS
jgi:hypothetical protein